MGNAEGATQQKPNPFHQPDLSSLSQWIENGGFQVQNLIKEYIGKRITMNADKAPGTGWLTVNFNVKC